MKNLLLFVMTFYTLFSNAQELHIDRTNPVSRNYAFFDEQNGLLKFKSTFTILTESSDILQDYSVRYTGIVKYVAIDKPEEKIEGIMERQGPSDFVATLKNKKGHEFQKKLYSGNIWDNIIITITYKLNGITYSVPSYIIYSDVAQQAKATKLQLQTSGTYLNNSTGIIRVNVSGVNGVTFTKIECSGNNSIKTTYIENENIVSSKTGSYEIKINLPVDDIGNYKVKVYCITAGENSTEIAPIEKEVIFQRQISITSIDGKSQDNKIYDLILDDSKKMEFKLYTTGEGKLTVDQNLNNYIVELNQISTGVYKLIISYTKLIFDDEQELTFRGNSGNKLEGKFTIKRPFPEITIGAEQTNANDVNFTVILPEWINGDLQFLLPNNMKIPASNSTAKKENGFKIFKKEIKSYNFSSNVSKDSIIVSSVKVMLSDKPLLVSQYKFINLAYYKEKIKTVQEDKNISSKDKKKNMNKIVTSMFSVAQAPVDKSKVKEVSEKLVSEKETERTVGWEDVASFAIKFAPVLLAAL